MHASTSRSLTVPAIVFAVLACSVIGTAAAHHSGAQYDSTDIVEMEATVVRFDFRNPHVYIVATDADGVEWMLETSSAVRMRREGWSKDSLTSGDQITFKAVSNRDPEKKRVRLMYLKGPGDLELDLMPQESGEPPEFPVAQSLEGVWGSDPNTFAEIGAAVTNYPLTVKGQSAKDAFDDSMDPVADCTTWSIPQLAIVSGLYPMKFELADDRVIIRYEFFNTERTIYMDGREHPANAPRTIQGHSIGHWNDDELVIDTRLFAEHRSPFMFDGVPSGAERHVIERYHLSEDGSYVTADFFVEDPEYLAKPIEFAMKLRYKPDFELDDNECDPEIARRFIQ